MKIKIISNGTAFGTKVVNAETGENVENISEIVWRCSVANKIAEADLRFNEVETDVIGETESEVKKDAKTE